MDQTMLPARLALLRGVARLLTWLEQLDAQLESGGGDAEARREYAQLLAALAAIAPASAPGGLGELISTRQLAERVGLHPKTVLRRMKQQGVEPVRFAKRGPGALRWPAR